MAIAVSIKRARLYAATLAADAAGQPLRAWLEGQILAQGNQSLSGRVVAGTSTGTQSVSFSIPNRGAGLLSPDDMLGLYAEFLDLVTELEATYTTNATLRDAMLADDSMNAITEYRTDHSTRETPSDQLT